MRGLTLADELKKHESNMGLAVKQNIGLRPHFIAALDITAKVTGLLQSAISNLQKESEQ